MAICDKDIKPIVFSEELVNQNIQKKYGLDPINKVEAVVDICPEIFQGPTYYTNFTKLVTGLTENSVGVFNVTNDSVVGELNFTGNTENLTAYTGYFEYKVYSRSSELITPQEPQQAGRVTLPPQNFNTTPTLTASTPYSAITENPFLLTIDFSGKLVNTDQEYLFNSNNKFIRNKCIFKGEVYSEPNLGNVYSGDSSWYFVTLVNPNVPILGPFENEPVKTPATLTVREAQDSVAVDKSTYVFAVPNQNSESDGFNCKLVNETLTINPIDPSIFSISKVPSPNTFLVAVNGITLSESDYLFSGDTIIQLSKPLDPVNDIITASYLDCDTNPNVIYSEQYQVVSAITSGVTSAVTTNDKVYFNTEQNKYEYYLDYRPSDADETMTLFLNGVKLTYGIDYYMSTSVDNRIIFDGISLVISDIIYVVYTSDGNLEGDYETVLPSTILEWKANGIVVNDRLNGEFLVDITESSDPNFTSTGVTSGITVDYLDGVSDYNIDIPKDILEGNKSYIWRVNSEKVYSGILDNIFITRSVSRIGKFKTNNEINSY